jgi:hypothetical protein
MAAGLSGRLARLEARAFEAGLRRISARQAGERDGGSAADVYTELRTVSWLIAARCGRHRDQRTVAMVIAERYGLKVAEVYADLAARRARGER